MMMLFSSTDNYYWPLNGLEIKLHIDILEQFEFLFDDTFESPVTTLDTINLWMTQLQACSFV